MNSEHKETRLKLVETGLIGAYEYALRKISQDYNDFINSDNDLLLPEIFEKCAVYVLEYEHYMKEQSLRKKPLESLVKKSVFAKEKEKDKEKNMDNKEEEREMNKIENSNLNSNNPTLVNYNKTINEVKEVKDNIFKTIPIKTKLEEKGLTSFKLKCNDILSKQTQEFWTNKKFFPDGYSSNTTKIQSLNQNNFNSKAKYSNLYDKSDHLNMKNDDYKNTNNINNSNIKSDNKFEYIDEPFDKMIANLNNKLKSNMISSHID